MPSACTLIGVEIKIFSATWLVISFGIQEELLQLDCMQNLLQHCTSENKSDVKFTEKKYVKIV